MYASLLVLLAVLPLTAAHSDAQSTQPPKAWAVKAIQSQAHDLVDYTTYLRYRIRTVDAKGDLTRDTIESRDGTVARLILKDNQPLAAELDADERTRLQAMLDDPAAFAKHIRSDRAARKQGVDLMNLIPDAMLFSYAAQQPANGIAIDFHPDPAWKPPTLASEVLTGLEGHALIDPASGHLIHLEANVFRPVNVGFGVFAHLYPGGSISLDLAPATPQRWLATHFVQHLTLRALMLKTYKQNADVNVSNATPIDAMTYQQAIHLLLNTH